MPDSLLISISLLQETRNALDVALSLAEPRTVEMPPVKAYSLIATARKNLDEALGKITVNAGINCSTMPPDKLKRKAKAIIALAHEVLNGLGDAA